MGTFSVGDVSYTVPDIYTPGYTINEFEAQALNDVRARAIGAAWGQRIRQTAKRGGTFDASQEALNAYADTYKLGNMPKGPGGRGAKDPVASEAKKLAAEKLRAHIKSQGGKVTDVPNFDELVAKLAEREDVIAQARARLDAAKSLDLGDLAVEVAPTAATETVNAAAEEVQGPPQEDGTPPVPPEPEHRERRRRG